MTLPLDGVRVIAFSQFGAGPFGMLQLADLGADVIKVEDPTTGGDVGRYVPPFRQGQDSLYYQSFNRNQRGVTLNLRVPEARGVLHDLARVSDAVFNNLRGDQPEKLGLTFRHLEAVNPRVVCCSLSGFGLTGPRHAQPGYDYLFQAYSGFMSLTGDPATPPAKSGVSIVDLSGGLAAALGLLAGVFQARSTGRGCDVDVSLFDTAISMLAYLASFNLNAGHQPERLPDSAHPTLYPSQVFETRDGYIVVTVMKEKFWPLLCDALERPDLIADPRFVDFDARLAHRSALLPLLSDAFRARATAEWLVRLAGDVPCAPVNTIEQALSDPAIAARGMLVETENATFGRMRHVAGAIKVVGHARETHAAAPDLGADTDDVLRDLLGYSPERIATLRATGAV